MRVFVIGALLALGACAVAAQGPPRAMPNWMSGYWLSCENGETAENWIGAGRGALLGTNLSGGGYEFLRIAPRENGQIVYSSMPDGRSPATEFVLTDQTEQRVVFENPAHDFPKRIIYARDGDVMTARIDDGANSAQAMEWRFQRASPDARCPS